MIIILGREIDRRSLCLDPTGRPGRTGTGFSLIRKKFPVYKGFGHGEKDAVYKRRKGELH
jgi:hypothetical protein